MANPAISSVTIDGARFNALSVHMGVGTEHDGTGLPVIGSIRCTIDVVVDVHDTTNLPYATLQSLFAMANGVTRDKIKTIKIEYWQDDSQSDAICTYTFEGWLSNFALGSGGGQNHLLHLSLQPKLDDKQFINIVMGN